MWLLVCGETHHVAVRHVEEFAWIHIDPVLVRDRMLFATVGFEVVDNERECGMERPIESTTTWHETIERARIVFIIFV